MTYSAPPTPPPATLAGRPGRGYAVVESLPSLGKGRTCTGIFLGGAADRFLLEALAGSRERVPFEGVVHSRHRSAEAALDVEVQRVEAAEGDELMVEFTARDVPYDVAG